MCFCNLYLVSDVFISHICQAACVILFCHVLLSFFCRVPCHIPLPLSSVMLFCLVILRSSFDVFMWHSVVVIYSRVCSWPFLTWARKDMREEGRKDEEEEEKEEEEEEKRTSHKF